MEIFAIVGGLLVIIGVTNIVKHIIKQGKPYEIVMGKVSHLKESKGSAITSDPLNTYYTPVFEYMYQGKTYKVEHNVRLSNKNKPSPYYTVGQSIEMRVYNEAPNEGVKNSSFGINVLLYGGIVCIILGIAFITLFLLVV